MPSSNGRLTAASTALMQFSGARKPRDGLAELREDLRLALRGGDLVVEVADLLERPLLVQHLLGEGDAGGGEITVHDLVDEADLQRFIGADRIAAHDHGESLFRANDARKT